VEAVIHWQARAQRQLGEDALRAVLAEKFPAYPQSSPIQGMALMATMSMTNDAPVVEHQKRAFLGLRLTSKDGRYIVQFMRDGFLFSRTQPYEHWSPFAAAAKEAWQIFNEIAAPVEIQRLGVRFINHLSSASPENLRDHLQEPPTCPSNLPLKEFVYQSTFAVPGHPFGVRVIKVMQPSMPELQRASGLFLDIDVYSTTAIANEPAALDDALVKMRWLKNKVFFTLLTEEAINAFA
jgi:uncharacterized protein (TIGR04255 family)